MFSTLALLSVRAATDSPTGNPWEAVLSTYSGYGVVGITAVVLGIVVWRLWQKDQRDNAATLDREIKRTEQERARADKAEERAFRAEQANAELNREIREKVVPVMIESTRATADLIAYRRDSR